MSFLHPSQRRLEDFVLGRLDLPQNHRIVRHLLTGCGRCREVTAGVWERLEEGLRAARQPDDAEEIENEGRYDEILDRALARASRDTTRINAERAHAPLLLDKLLRHPLPRQITLVRNSRSYRSWALCELVLRESFELRFDDPRRSLELAELGLEVARQVQEKDHSRELKRDLEARAWAYLGNARRVASDLAGAEEAFLEARSLLEEGTGDPLERALVCRFRAHLEVVRRRFDHACGLYDQACALYRRCGETDTEAALILDKGFALATAGEPEQAVPLLREGLRRVDWQAEPRRVLAARHNLVDCLNDAGRPVEALRCLEELRPAYSELGDRMNLLKLRWLEGKILTDLDQPIAAETALVEARQGFAELGAAYDSALVALDLTANYVRTGQAWKVAQLAAETLPIFESRRVERDTLAAIVAFRRAAELEQVTVGMVRQLATKLRSR